MDIEDVAKKYENIILGLPGVVAYSISLSNPKPFHFQKIIVVDVESVRSIAAIPKTLDGHPVRVDVVGKVTSYGRYQR